MVNFDEFKDLFHLLSPPVIMLSLVWVLSSVSRKIVSKNRPRQAEPASSTSGYQISRRKIRNEFLPRPPGHRGLLGETWAKAHESKGWIVMLGILLTIYLSRQAYVNYKSHGSLFTAHGGDFLHKVFVIEFIEFASFLIVLYSVSFSALIFQKAMIKFNLDVFGRAVVHAVQHVVMITMVFCATFYVAYYRAYNVSITFRFAAGCEILVIYLKMVSYLGTNHYLWTLSRFQKEHTTDQHATQILSRMFGRKSVVQAYQLLDREQIDKMTHEQVCGLLVNRGVDVEKFEPSSIDGHGIPESPRGNERAARKFLIELVELDEYRKSAYPSNVTFWNFVEYSVLPVVVYEPKYPRSSHVNWVTVIEKILTAFGITLFMWSMFENHILPRIIDMNEGRENGGKVDVMIDTIIPLQLYLVGQFYMLYECILGANAELTRLADREFYGDWWNSTSFEEFARKWNRPIHEFLLRHVHLESQVTLGLNRSLSTMVTFLYSIIAHEILFLNTMGLFRPYLAFLSLFQLPLWPLMRSQFITNKLLGNVIFWISLMIAWPLMTVLYCRDYCKADPRNCRIDI